MTAGYAAFQTNLKIKGTSSVSSNWDIKITNVTQANKTGSAEEAKAPTWNNLTAYMEANLYEKGDAIEYDVTVENNGTLDASLDEITENIQTTNEAVKITFSGYNKGEKLYKNTSQIIKVKIEYNPDINGTPEEGSGEISIDLNYVQAEGGTIAPTDKYLVTYDCSTNGGNDCSSYNEYLNEGESINLSKTVTKEGYEFIGWNTDKDATEALTELTMPSENITLYAIFKDEAPKCELTIKEATIENITVKTTCENEENISQYKYSINGEEYVNTEKDEYTFESSNLSTIKVEVIKKTGLKNTFTISEENLQKGYQLIYDVLQNGFQNLSKRQEKAQTDILDKTYPVGSIYTSDQYATVEQVNEAIGGTWEEYGKGRTLVGVDENDSNFNTVNKTGGSKTTTLAVTNLPSHTHSIPALSGTAASAGAHTHTRGTMNIGGTINVRGVSGDYAVMEPTGVFSRTRVNWSGSHSILSHTSANPANYTALYFDASRNWAGATSSAGAHTHTVTTTANNTGSAGSGTSFTNLQPYITVYIYRRIG